MQPETAVFERFSRSWGLIKASAGVLAQDKELLVFPLLSAICALVVAAAFVLPALGLGALDGLGNGGVPLATYLLAFLFYLAQYFVIFFFNSALVGAAMIRLDGGDPTLRDGLRIAAGKALPILGYAAIAATVGMVLRALQGRRFVEFEDLFQPEKGSTVMVVTFIALLELAKETLIEITQAEAFAPIYVRLAYTPA